jgi:hypothetical protein
VQLTGVASLVPNVAFSENGSVAMDGGPDETQDQIVLGQGLMPVGSTCSALLANALANSNSDMIFGPIEVVINVYAPGPVSAQTYPVTAGAGPCDGLASCQSQAAIQV